MRTLNQKEMDIYEEIRERFYYDIVRMSEEMAYKYQNSLSGVSQETLRYILCEVLNDLKEKAYYGEFSQ